MTATILPFKKPEKKEPAKEHKNYYDFYNHFGSYEAIYDNWGSWYHGDAINDERKDKDK